MEIGEISMERGALRIAIDGDWLCAELSSFLARTEDIYRRLNSVYVLNYAIEQEARRIEGYRSKSQYDRMDYSWHSQYFGLPLDHLFGSIRSERPKYLELIELTSAVSEPLGIDAITYASPGWIQLIGNLNPLKVIADFISKWRAENTKRQGIQSKERVDTMRIRGDLAAEILRQLPKTNPRDGGINSRLVDIAQDVIGPTTAYLESTANNIRVIDAEVVSPHQPLPPVRRSKL